MSTTGLQKGTHQVAAHRAVRAIAAFEAFKGALVLAGGLGFLTLLHHDLRPIAEHFIRHARFDPQGRYPTIFLQWVDHLDDMNMWVLLGAAAFYVTLRFAEAVGLWFERAWGEWLGALSGVVYLPLEVQHLIHAPQLSSVLLLVFNLLVVSILGYRLWQRRSAIGSPGTGSG